MTEETKEIQQARERYVRGDISEEELEAVIEEPLQQDLTDGSEAESDNNEFSFSELLGLKTVAVPDRIVTVLFRLLRSSKDSWMRVDPSSRTFEITVADPNDIETRDGLVESTGKKQALLGLIPTLYSGLATLAVVYSLPSDPATPVSIGTQLLSLLLIPVLLLFIGSVLAPDPVVKQTRKEVGTYVADRD